MVYVGSDGGGGAEVDRTALARVARLSGTRGTSGGWVAGRAGGMKNGRSGRGAYFGDAGVGVGVGVGFVEVSGSRYSSRNASAAVPVV